MLILPAICGLILNIWQFYHVFKVDSSFTVMEAIDNEYTAIYGVCLSIWAAVILASWKEKEEVLKEEWDVNNSKGVLISDERKGEFKF